MVGIGNVPASGGPRRGDIHVVMFPDEGGHVIRGPHPAVVVSTDRLNRPLGTVLVCPLTSRVRHDIAEYVPPYLVPITRKASGLDRDGYAKIDQILIRSAEALGARIGRVNPETMASVDRALRFVLDL
jgi:mRNA-degrading endonuclease toxin of MazEF toxin-antitoxin module